MVLFEAITIVPIVGSCFITGQAVVAIINGDRQRFHAKAAQASVGFGMDALLIASGGLSSLADAPLKTVIYEGGKIVGKQLIKQSVPQVGVRGYSEYMANKFCNESKAYRLQKEWEEKMYECTTYLPCCLTTYR